MVSTSGPPVVSSTISEAEAADTCATSASIIITITKILAYGALRSLNHLIANAPFQIRAGVGWFVSCGFGDSYYRRDWEPISCMSA